MVGKVGRYADLYRSSVLIGHFLNLKKFLVGRLVDVLTWRVIGHDRLGLKLLYRLNIEHFI